VKRYETAFRNEDQPYTIQVPKKVTKMVKVTKKVPRTVYVNMVTEEPREEIIMVPETRTRRVKIPYQKEVIDQQYRTVKESVPVTKFRTEYDTVVKTIYEDAWRTKVVLVTKMVHKDIPVYEVVPNDDCTNCVQMDAPQESNNHREPAAQVLPESNYNDHMKPYVETYPPHVETHPQSEPIRQVIPQYEQQPVMKDPTPTPVMQHAPVPDNDEPVQVMKSSEQAPLTNSSEFHEEQNFEKSNETASLANASKSQEEQKSEKFIKTKYSVPAEYDTNNDGVIDTQEFDNAREDGNVHVDGIAVVQNPKEGGAVVEEHFSQAPRQNETRRRKKKKKSGGKRKRKSRR